MWKDQILRSDVYAHRNQDGIQTRLRGMITSYVVKNFPGHQITAFAEVGMEDQFNILAVTGKKVERGFYLRLRPFADDEPGLISLWALEDLNPLEVVTNKQVEYGRSNEELSIGEQRKIR